MVALTAICSYVVNPLVDAVSLLRFGFLFLGATLGAFGILAGGILLLLHLITLRSFGTPYFMPFAPVVKRQWRDALLKAPIWALDRRYLDGPASLHRQAPNQKPGPQQDKKSQREQAKEE